MARTGSKQEPRFILFGAQGEYVLGPLADALLKKGHDCTEIVARAGFDAMAAIAALPPYAGKTVLVTCAHILHDTESMQEFLGIPDCPPLLSVIRNLRPDLTVYYPHDLSSPFLWDEYPYAHLIDLYLGATDCERALRRRMDVEIVGWIKLRRRRGVPERRGRALWLCMGTETVIQKIGVKRTFAAYKPHLRDWCSVKLPPYDYCKPMERMIEETGATAIDCFETPPDHVPHYDLVISNGPSSVVREAGLMGKPVFILTADGVFPKSYLKDMNQFSDLPYLRFVGSIDDIPATAPTAPPLLHPFDAARAMAAILKRI